MASAPLWCCCCCLLALCALLMPSDGASLNDTDSTDDYGSGNTTQAAAVVTPSGAESGSPPTPAVPASPSRAPLGTSVASPTPGSTARNTSGTVAASPTTILAAGPTEVDHFSELSVGTLVAISIGCVLFFMLSLFAVHILRKSKQHQHVNKQQAKRIRASTERSKRQSRRVESELAAVTDWASSPLSSATLAYMSEEEALSSGGPDPTASKGNSTTSLLSKQTETKSSWTDEQEVEETGFSSGGSESDGMPAPRVHNYVVVEGDQRRTVGKHTRAKDRAREILAERRAAHQQGGSFTEAGSNAIAEEDDHVFVANTDSTSGFHGHEDDIGPGDYL